MFLFTTGDLKKSWIVTNKNTIFPLICCDNTLTPIAKSLDPDPNFQNTYYVYWETTVTSRWPYIN